MAKSDLIDPTTTSRPRRVWQGVTQTFFKGLIAILPIAVTVYVLVWLAGYLDTPGRHLIHAIQTALKIEPYDIPYTGLLASLVVIFLIGLLINAWLVQQFFAASESLLQRLPLAKTVLSSVRDLMDFFSKSGKSPAGQVVLVSLTSSGVKMIGFITRQDLSDLSIGTPGVPGTSGTPSDDLVAVYVPFSYAVGGFTMLVPRSAIQPLNMPAEEAMRFALTAGMKKAEPAPKDGEKT